MKIALLGEFPSQPIKNLTDSIKRHSKHNITLYHRFANLLQIDADVIYYVNILDLLLHKEAYSQIKNKKYNICTTIRSYKIVQDKDIQKKLREMEQYIKVLSFTNNELLKKIDFNNCKMITKDAPDDRVFYQTHTVSIKDKLKLGYVGTYRDDKRFGLVLEPLIKKYEQIVEFLVVGKAGVRIPYNDMNGFYNTIDALLMPSRYEGTSMPPLEAALCGRMSVVTECPAMKEVFDTTSAKLIGLSDNIPSTVAAFEDAILELYEHRNDTIIKGQKAKKDVKEKRNWKDVIKDYDNMFERCIDG